jgi:signal transduction histidine kinase
MSTDQPRARFFWTNSLIVRVIGLCVILLFCLLLSVYAITRFYFHQIALERTEAIAQGVQIYLEEHSGARDDLEQVAAKMMERNPDLGDLSFVSDMPIEPPKVEQLTDSDGNVVIVASTSIRSGDRPLRLEARFFLRPQSEVLRAFRDRFLVAVTAVFLGVLGLLVYLIYKALRPLQELSETCAQVSEGNLNEVVVKQNYGEVLALEQTFNRMVRSLREKEIVESNLRQAQRLSALGTLAAGVAHDIRNPLNAIKLLSSHTLSSLEKNPGYESAARNVTTIRSEVDRLEEIVSGFLSLAKEHELQPEPTRVDSLLKECINLVGKDAEARSVKLVVELRAGETALMLDPKHWTRAVLNVLINAMEACPPGGRVRLFSRTTDSRCEIEVRDDGPGLPKDVAEKIFDPYFTTKPTGTGLGLSITRGIVEEHGGTISITSIEGQGCQVLITLPLETRTA